MKKFIIGIIVSMMLFSGSIGFASDDTVPPCPDEYKGGLIP